MALANTQQLAGGQQEVIIQLCFTELCVPLNWVILLSVLSTLSSDINMFLISLLLPVIFVYTGLWPWMPSQKSSSGTEAP